MRPQPRRPRREWLHDRCLARAASRGTLKITSVDLYAAPVIDPNYFSSEQDLQAVLSGIMTARKIASSSALAEWGIEEMGANNASVVDSELRVHGLHGLRVADASVIPSIPSNNTNATVCAIAERAADVLRAS
jgi:choline dehydrogenase